MASSGRDKCTRLGKLRGRTFFVHLVDAFKGIVFQNQEKAGTKRVVTGKKCGGLVKDEHPCIWQKGCSAAGNKKQSVEHQRGVKQGFLRIIGKACVVGRGTNGNWEGNGELWNGFAGIRRSKEKG